MKISRSIDHIRQLKTPIAFARHSPQYWHFFAACNPIVINTRNRSLFLLPLIHLPTIMLDGKIVLGFDVNFFFVKSRQTKQFYEFRRQKFSTDVVFQQDYTRFSLLRLKQLDEKFPTPRFPRISWHEKSMTEKKVENFPSSNPTCCERTREPILFIFGQICPNVMKLLHGWQQKKALIDEMMVQNEILCFIDSFDSWLWQSEQVEYEIREDVKM